MKIGFDAKRYYHNHTGLGNYSRTLVHALQRQFPEHSYELYDAKSFTRTFRLGTKAADDECQIYHGLSNELPFDLGRLTDGSQRYGIATVVTIHDVCWRTFPEMYHWLDRHLYDWKYGSACRRADQIVAISESTKQDIVRHYGIAEDKIHVVYQPVAELFYHEPNEEIVLPDYLPKDYILYVGSLNARKNLLSILEALTLMPAGQRPPLIVVGNGHEYRNRCEQYIAEHQMQDSVFILSNVKDNMTLQQLYRKAMAFVYPSFYEGFGLPVVEAALQQTPVITSNVSSLPEAAGPDALYVDPHSPDAPNALAEHLGRLLADSDWRKHVGCAMEHYARTTFEPTLLTQQMMDLYRSLI